MNAVFHRYLQIITNSNWGAINILIFIAQRSWNDLCRLRFDLNDDLGVIFRYSALNQYLFVRLAAQIDFAHFIRLGASSIYKVGQVPSSRVVTVLFPEDLSTGRISGHWLLNMHD